MNVKNRHTAQAYPQFILYNIAVLPNTMCWMTVVDVTAASACFNIMHCIGHKMLTRVTGKGCKGESKGGEEKEQNSYTYVVYCICLCV